MVALYFPGTGSRYGSLGIWQGAAENHGICEELVADIGRGVFLAKKTLFIADGGKGGQEGRPG